MRIRSPARGGSSILCHTDVAFRVICGANLPGHSTIARFRAGFAGPAAAFFKASAEWQVQAAITNLAEDISAGHQTHAALDALPAGDPAPKTQPASTRRTAAARPRRYCDGHRDVHYPLMLCCLRRVGAGSLPAAAHERDR